MNPVRALHENLPAKANRPALHDGDLTLSHSELIARVEAAAADLFARGLSGRRIGLSASNSWRHVVAYLSILRAGAVWVPLNPLNGPGLNDELIARAGLDLLIAETEAEGALDLAAWLDAARPGPLPNILDDPDADFAIKFTGGTTGKPKGVIQSQASAAAALRSMRAFYRFTDRDVNLAVAPLTHGSSHYVLPVLAAGGAHVVMARPERAAILDELKRRVTTVFMPPTLIYLLMGEARFGPHDFPALRRLTYSAAPMPPARVAETLARFGPVLDSLYGQTEAPMAITAQTPADMADPALAGSVGRPFAGTPVRILTADGGVAQVGEGEVLVGGDLARTTYLDDPQATAAARQDGWLRTGDIGRLGADGRLTLIGRAREMIISGGYNIYPAEAEAALAGHPAVREVCAFGVDDATWGERLEAAVALSASVDDAELTAFVRDRLGPVRTPKALHRLDALPRNPVGKVVRAEVKQLIYPAPRPDEETFRTRETT